MSFVYLLARIYPYWALALGMVLFQLAVFFRRRQSSVQYSLLGAIGFLGLGILAWFYFRGDLHSDDWVRYMTGR
jgi:hypothetical protein